MARGAWRSGRRAGLLGAISSAMLVVSILPAAASSGAGNIRTISGGPGSGPGPAIGQHAQAFTISGSTLYVADALANAVRKLSLASPNESVIAGIDVAGYSGDGGPAIAAELNDPHTLAVDASHHLLIGDVGNGVIRVVATTTGTAYGIAMTSGDIYTIAGGGHSTADGIAAATAELDPEGLALDSSGNVVIADGAFATIRVVAESTATFYGQAMTKGDIYTLAGTGSAGYSGDGGLATSAQFTDPLSVAFDRGHNLVIDDYGNNAIRLLARTNGSRYGQSWMWAGHVYTVAGTGSAGFSGDGGPATSATLNGPQTVGIDHSGNVVISDSINNRVRVLAVFTATFYGQPMLRWHIYTVAGDGTAGFSGDGGPATSAEFSTPVGAAADHDGNLVIGDGTYAYRVRAVAATSGTYYGQAISGGDVNTVAGNGLSSSTNNGAAATSAELAGPYGVASDSSGNVLGSEYYDNLVRVIAGAGGTYYGQALIKGRMYTVAGNAGAGFSGDGGPATQAQLLRPEGIGVDAARDLAIADNANQRIRFVPAVSGTYFAQPMTGGDIYTIAGNGGFGYAPDGVLATSTTLYNPSAAAFDAAGNLLIPDVSAGRAYVVARGAGTFYGRSMLAGHIYNVAGGGSAVPGDGGPATGAQIGPGGGVVDASHNLLLPDGQNYRLRVVPTVSGTYYGQAMTAGDIYTIAGDGTFGYTGDGGPATNAEVTPGGVALDPAGDIIIDDQLSDTVRIVCEHTGTHYGQVMTAGDIYTIAGTGVYGFGGDGGSGTAALMGQPTSVTVTPGSAVVIADNGNNRLREVSGP